MALSGQSFRNFPVPNFQPAVYALSIRSPGAALLDYATFTFALSPQALRTEYPALTNHYLVQDDPQTGSPGVAVKADNYGTGPPLIIIEGTTGWQRHGSTGYLSTGLQDIQNLKAFLAEFDTLNQEQMAAGDPDLYALEFYDYFSNEFWQVVPEGPQLIWQTRERPLLHYYRLRLQAMRPVGAPLLGLLDALLQTFATPATAAVVNASIGVGSFLASYSPVGEL